MKKGDIVTVVAISGEYVGTFDSQLDTTITLTQPKMIVSNPEGGMGFARGVAVTGDENPAVITFNNYVFATESNEGVQNAYLIATGQKEAPRVEVPAEKKIIT
jgi:hypothetical protein|tara:strand:+ start:3474 stop:3782 length:309 start_codon:yes stop_codon:yes gene_type:complete